ncbi:reverse transcriptase domain-containing protein [Tanacetum coccineum]
MPSHIKTYDGSRDPEDHLKLFQSDRKVGIADMVPYVNSTLTGNARVWFDKLPKESIDSYEDLRIAFRENYLQQTKHIKDLVEIHHIKQRDGESTEDFMERYKAEVLDVEGAPECMRISGFMQRIIPTLGEVAAFSHSQRKASSSWKQSEKGFKMPNFKKGLQKLNNRPVTERAKIYSQSTPKRQKKFSLWKKESYQRATAPNGPENDKPKAPKKGEASRKDKPLTILMIQPWERVAKPRITQSLSPETAMSFPPLGEEDGTEGPMIIEAKMDRHFMHRDRRMKENPHVPTTATRNVINSSLKGNGEEQVTLLDSIKYCFVSLDAPAAVQQASGSGSGAGPEVSVPSAEENLGWKGDPLRSRPGEAKGKIVKKADDTLPAKRLRIDHPSLASGTGGKTLASLRRTIPEGSLLLRPSSLADIHTQVTVRSSRVVNAPVYTAADTVTSSRGKTLVVPKRRTWGWVDLPSQRRRKSQLTRSMRRPL